VETSRFVISHCRGLEDTTVSDWKALGSLASSGAGNPDFWSWKPGFLELKIWISGIENPDVEDEI